MLFKKIGISCFVAFSLCVQGQVTNIPDTNFEQSLLDQGIDSDGLLNGEVLTADIDVLIALNIFNEDIQDFTGIEDFVSLVTLDCSDNFVEGSLDLSSNVNLEVVFASYSALRSLNVSNSPNLRILNINDNELTSLDVSNNPLLEEIRLGNQSEDVFPFNEFPNLDFSANPQLRILDCHATYSLTSVNLNGATDLRFGNFEGCALTSIDVSMNVLLEELRVGYVDAGFSGTSNNLVSVDVSNNPNLVSLLVQNTDISSLNIQNGANDILTNLSGFQTPNLSCILVDDETAATNGDAPYGSWSLDAGTQFSETECTIGVEDYLLESVQLFPNPVDDVMNVQNSHKLALDAITIYDITGKEVYTAVGTAINSINIQSLPSGVYFVRLHKGDAVATKRVLKL